MGRAGKDMRADTKIPSSTRMTEWALSEPGWLQGVFSTLVGLFDRVGLKKNVGNMVGIVCRPCQVVVIQLEAAHK